jgi:hypothetical protein
MRASRLAVLAIVATLSQVASAQQTTPPDPQPAPTTTTTAPAPPAAPPPAPPPPPQGAYPYPPPGYAPYPYPPPYPPYGYPPPPYGYAPPEPPPRPAVIPYEEGDEIPPGYHLESRVRRGPVIAGTILFATTYGINLLAASFTEDEDEELWLYVPGVGTWPLVGNCSDGSDDGCEFLVLHSIAHTLGLGLLIYGVAAQRSVLVRESAVIVVPARIGSGNGLLLHAGF